MKLGNLEISNNLLLAPLQNITTSPFRRFCRRYFKVGLVFIPMIYTKRITRNVDSIEQELLKISEEKPISIQLMGRDLEDFKRTLGLLESYDIDGIDINAGCSSRRALNSKSGAYLIIDLKHLKKILNLAVKHSSFPVSLKTRIGESKPNNLQKITETINDSDIDFLTVHARTIDSKFDREELNLEALKTIKKLSKIPVIGNGDIKNPIFAKKVLDYTKVDGLMIGRESMGNPEIFSQISNYLAQNEYISFKNNLDLWFERLKLYEDCIDEYLDGLQNLISAEEYKFSELKRNSIWLTKGLKNSTIIRRKLSQTKKLENLKSTFQEIMNSKIIYAPKINSKEIIQRFY
ncbi:MAG: tRNA-dihydrouridine synthase family protein [Promethearchaeota archaeon]|nr:MAG: tRNA-dihydrouridine synthase family protein [Candidatus Lokiarchaeota archaeon]